MDERPKMRPALTTIDKAAEILGWFSVACLWIMTLKNYSSLPVIIPVHYNAAGDADGFGGKPNILIVPVLVTILFTGLTLLNRFPYIFNYPTPVTQENALRLYTLATRLIRYLKLIMVIIFGFIAFRTIQNANGNPGGPGIWFLPLILILVFIPLIYGIMKLLKSR